MSTAAAFNFHDVFPWCISDISGDVPASALYVDNLTLAAAMAFYWNFESFTFTTVGTATRGTTTVDGGLDVTLSPPASTFFDRVNNVGGGTAWSGEAFGDYPIASAPPIRQPNERVCIDEAWEVGKLTGLEFDFADPETETGGMEFVIWLGTDPVNSGRYRIYYSYTLNRSSEGDFIVNITWTNRSTPDVPSDTPLASGTFTMGGHAFNYYSYHDGTSATGGTLTASSVSFTY